MGVITIHSLDEGLVEQITRLAEANRHSLEQEVVSLLQDGLRKRAQHDDLVDRIKQIAAMTPKGVPQTDSVDLLREDRDR